MHRLLLLLTLIPFIGNAQNVLNSTGAVGIGTTTPLAGSGILQVAGADGTVLMSLNATGGNGRLFMGTDASANAYLRSMNAVDLRFGVGANDYMALKNSGYFGIGTVTPTQLFEVNGAAGFTGSGYASISRTGTYINSGNIYAMASGGVPVDLTMQSKNLSFYTGTTLSEKMRIDLNGNVGIGTFGQPEKLSVDGTIKAKQVVVTTSDWADYVFNSSYKLTPLKNLESFIEKNKHLPEIPSEMEVKEKGINVAETQTLLLKKIEELTLYVIDISKRSVEQDKKIKRLDSQRAELMHDLKMLKKKRL